MLTSLTNFGIKTNIVDLEEQSDLVPHCLSQKSFKWTSRPDDI